MFALTTYLDKAIQNKETIHDVVYHIEQIKVNPIFSPFPTKKYIMEVTGANSKKGLIFFVRLNCSVRTYCSSSRESPV